ncbi:MAG: putative quinol monooxygenase, partial [Sandaracinobacteroides sp.]
MIIIIGRGEFDASRIAELRPALKAMMRHTFEESGCLSYSLAIEHEGGPGEPAILTLAERWADECALKSHFESEHMAAFNRAIEGAVYSIDVKMFDATNERPLALS